MQPPRWQASRTCTPFAPADQTKGYRHLIAELEQDLATITGFAACSLQPTSGAGGRILGLMVIRAYHQSRGQGYRNVVLIPASAHGTNPASAAMAGMKIVTVACDANGNIDVDDLEAKAKEHSSELCRPDGDYLDARRLREPHPRNRRRRPRRRRAGIHGRRQHERAGGTDELPAHRGRRLPPQPPQDLRHAPRRRRPASICVAEHLQGLPPSHSVVATGGDEGITAVASAPWGSALLCPDHLRLYQKMLGAEGLSQSHRDGHRQRQLHVGGAGRRSTAPTIEGETGRVGHEMILDLTSFKTTTTSTAATSPTA